MLQNSVTRYIARPRRYSRMLMESAMQLQIPKKSIIKFMIALYWVHLHISRATGTSEDVWPMIVAKRDCHHTEELLMWQFVQTVVLFIQGRTWQFLEHGIGCRLWRCCVFFWRYLTTDLRDLHRLKHIELGPDVYIPSLPKDTLDMVNNEGTIVYGLILCETMVLM